MKSKFIRWLLVGIFLATSFMGLGRSEPASAAASTTIRIVKYAADGTTVLDEETVSIATLESTLAVQGDGTTHYYTEGPTFDPSNLWDPTEICPADSLKDKGALKGTAISDICSLVGGAAPGDQINIKASDGYNETFQYANVYNTLSSDLNARQGQMVICWSKDGSYSGSAGWTDGMLLAFFTQSARASDGKLIFGHQDMHDCLPEDNWHWYYQNSIQYPSTHGLSIKYINQISIYSGGVDEWEVALSGARDDSLTQSWFENGLACHDNFTYDDGAGNVWSGLPLWYVVGLVDDDNIHGPNSYNDELAAAGYNIKVVAADGYSYIFESADVARNDHLILANILNGAALPESKYPLKLVSPDFPNGGPSVAQIASIELTNLPTGQTPPPTPPAGDPLPTVAQWPLQLRGALSEDMTKSSFLAGVNCHEEATYTDDSGNVWSGLPLWMLVSRVDDSNIHGEGCFNEGLAALGYDVKVWAADGYSYTFSSAAVARNNNILVANKFNGAELPAVDPLNASKPWFPLKLVGSLCLQQLPRFKNSPCNWLAPLRSISPKPTSMPWLTLTLPIPPATAPETFLKALLYGD
jgi:hypothetical protein